MVITSEDLNNPTNSGEEGSSSEEKGQKRHRENNGDESNKSTKMNMNSQDEYHGAPSERHVSKKWRHIGEIFANDGENHAFYGQSAAFSCDGTRFAIGCYSQNGDASVKVSDFKEGHWSVVGNICGLFEDEVEEFGWNIALSANGKVLAIRTRHTDEKGLCSGNVAVHRYTEGANWTLMGCILEGTRPGDWFGHSIVLSEDGNRIAIGAPGEGGRDGSVSIFDFDGTNWVPMGQNFSVEDDYDSFGTAMSFSADGSIIATGAPESDGGSIQVFQHSSFGNADPNTAQENGQWVQVGNTLHGEASDDLFGYLLSINAIGDVVTVGAPGGEYIQVFYFHGNEWHQMGRKLLAEIDMEGSISLDGNRNRIAVFPKNDDERKVKVYEYNEDEWKPIGDAVEAPSSEYCFGSSVLLSSCCDRLSIAYVHDKDGFVGIHDFK